MWTASFFPDATLPMVVAQGAQARANCDSVQPPGIPAEAGIQPQAPPAGCRITSGMTEGERWDDNVS